MRGEQIASPASDQPDDSALQAGNASAKVRGLTLRAILISALFLFFSAKWVVISEVVVADCLVAESVPPIPAVAALILMAAFISILGKLFRKRALTPNEVMVIFAMMAVGVTIMGDGALKLLFGTLLPLFYYASPSNNYAEFHQYVPTWFNPRNQQVVNELFEGSYTGVTPWGVWLPYLALWTGFFLILFLTMMCLIRIFYHYWARQERLTFPIVQIATALAQSTSPGEGESPFFRNPLAWLGFGIAFLFNLANMIRAFNPDFPALGTGYEIPFLSQERPWSAAGSLYFRWDPAVVGMGYLMSAEVLLSAVVGHFLIKAQSVAAAAVGYEASFPNLSAASGGAYLVVLFLLVWRIRGYLWQSLRRAIGLSAPEQGVPLAPRWAVAGTAVGLALLGLFFLACKISLRRQGADLSLWVMAAFMFLFFAFALVYARIRAESGAPMSWLFPRGAHQYFIYNFLGTKRILSAGGPGNLMMLSELWVISVGFFQNEMAVQLENFHIGETTRAGTGAMARAGTIGLFLGLAFGFYFYMAAYYNYGGNILQMDGGERIYGEAVGWVNDPNAADAGRGGWIAAALVAMGATAGIAFARTAFFRFPLHPLGLAMGLTQKSPTLFAPFMLAWLCKTAAMKVGGMRLYRRLIPLFLGLVVGHYFTGGVVWGLLGITEHPAFFRYRVYFG